MSKTFRMPLEKIKEKYAPEEEKQNLISKIKKIKAIDFLINSVNIKEIEPRKDDNK